MREIREDLPALGTRKLYYLLAPRLAEHNVKLGRDALFKLLASRGMLIRRKRSSTRTTFSYRWFNRYDNLIKNWSSVAPGQLWVSDITYIRMGTGFAYLSLVTDAFSRKIVGYHVAQSLHAINTLKALQMALKNEDALQKGIIHHSDRGSQYCSAQYVETLNEYGFNISMTQNSDPLDNSIAERVNGIIKQEFIDHYHMTGIRDAKRIVARAVNAYNFKRPHLSLNYKTPSFIHQTVNHFQDYFKLVNPSQDLVT